MWKARYAITRTDAKGREHRIFKQMTFDWYYELVRYREAMIDDPHVTELFEKVETPWYCHKRG